MFGLLNSGCHQRPRPVGHSRLRTDAAAAGAAAAHRSWRIRPLATGEGRGRRPLRAQRAQRCRHQLEHRHCPRPSHNHGSNLRVDHATLDCLKFEKVHFRQFFCGQSAKHAARTAQLGPIKSLAKSPQIDLDIRICPRGSPLLSRRHAIAFSVPRRPFLPAP